MTRPLLALFASLTFAGGCACDVQEWARDRAGGSGIDCGTAQLGESHDDVHQCTVDAFLAGEAFIAVFERQGFDSFSRLAWASDGQSVWIANYDSDPSGGGGAGATIHERGCANTRVVTGTSRPMISEEQEFLRCDETYYESVCG